MALTCRCGSPVYSLGVPDCNIKMAPIVRMLFTTYANNIATSPSALDLVPSNTVYPDLYKIATPILAEVTSERPEAITEEVGATKYFVRQSSRSITATIPVIPPNFGRFISLLRCQNELGVFLVDANGVVWSARQDTATGFAAKPIPVIPASINALFEFPSYTTVKKTIITMEMPFSFEDFELIPAAVSDNFLSYQVPLPVGWRVLSPTAAGPGAGSWRVRLFDEYLAGAGVSASGITGVTPSDIVIRNLTTFIVSTGNTDLGDGYYDLQNPLIPGDSYILDVTAATSPAGYDWTGVYHRFLAP